jgi:RNA polymerase sigma-70 factor (ECF subfamily)
VSSNSTTPSGSDALPANAAVGDIFATTHWTVVLAAGRRSTPQADHALEELCRTYWYPLYAYARRRGHGPEDAQDLTQEFFARLLAKHWIESADREKGRFRTFLLTAMSRFLGNEWHRAGAQKRGGYAAHLPLDAGTAESRYEADSAITLTPDRLYDRQWAMTLLDRALTRLRTEQERAGKAREFAVLSPFLTAERGGIPYDQAAAQLGVNHAAARQAVHRVRKRFREVFREEITQTVAAPEEVEEEIRHLLAALSG